MHSALRTVSDRVDETGHDIISCNFKNSSTNNKKYKEQIVNKIKASICAMLNSNGGKVVLYNDCKCKSPICLSLVVQILDQSMISIIGSRQTVSKIDFKENKASVVIFVKKADSLITTNYKLYLPSQTQVVLVDPWDLPEHVKDDIINRKVVLEPVHLGSHRKIFLKDKNCGFHENKTVQLKHVKADQSKRTRLADRMTGKDNKFSCYVSAFANHSGGHIYYGIMDDSRVVEGELIPNEEDKSEIAKKVEKAINKMIWPEQIGQPKRWEHWEIFFEPVVDKNSKPIASTFVIVIYIAPCLGGVFTDEPECYEMVEGKVEKMSFTTWKKRIMPPLWFHRREEIPPSVQRTTWSSDEAREAFTAGHKELMPLINNGKWVAILKKGESLEKKSQLDEIMNLLVLSKQVTACFRRGRFNEARALLEQYTVILPHAEDRLIFEVMELYLQAALKRASGDFKELKELLAAALSKAELIEPGLVTASVYVFAGTVTDLVNPEDPTKRICLSPDVLSVRALEHLRCVPDSADIRKKIDFTLATFHLGCNISGRGINGIIDISRLKKANTSIMNVHRSICDGNPLSEYHKVQFNLVQSMYHYRHSQVKPDERTRLLGNAFNCAKEAEDLAKKNQFTEMVEWSKANEALCTEELVRTQCCSARKSIQPENN